MLLVLYLACSPEPKDDTEAMVGPDETDADTDSDTDADTDSDADADACTLTVLGLEPLDGAVDVAPNSLITASFSAAITDESITLSLEPSVPGSLLVAEDGLSATLTPDGPLDYSSSYTATASVCESSLTSTFSIMAEPPDLDLVGNTYVIDLRGSDITWVEPAGFGSILMSYLVIDGLILQVEDQDEASLDTIAAAAVASGNSFNQFVCIEPIDFEPADFSMSPFVAAGPKDTVLSFSGYNVDTYELRVEGSFSSDGQSVEDIRVSGLADARDINPGIGFDICDLISCVACPDNAMTCISLIIEDTEAPIEAGLEIDPTINPANFPECR